MIVGDNPELAVQVAHALDNAASEIGIDYIAGYSALVHKGIAAGDAALLQALPEALQKKARQQMGDLFVSRMLGKIDLV